MAKTEGGVTMLGSYELNQIVTGDARELARGIPDESVDLIFTDPPYNLGKKYGDGIDDDLRREDFKALVDWLVPELLRIGRTVLVTPGIANLDLYLVHRPKWIIAWHKPFGVSHCPVGFNNWEPVLFWGKWARNNYSDYINAPLNLSEKFLGLHECPKPLLLMTQIIERYSNANDIVFDPFCGSGTTCKAAKMLGRQYLAFEIDPATAERARERVRNTQPPLFVLQPEQVGMELDV